ncbi:MAG: glutamate 5-kinase [Solirubrobacteraceae bacterium]|nr:MAG: glutamate 5-kinase [Solirubrobacterales bacterium]
MARTVVKLGSSIVADDSGELRLDVLERVCDEAAALHSAGGDVVIVTSGAIARGIRLLALPLRPRAVDELQAASAVGQGKLYRAYDELLRARGVVSAQVLLTFFDVSARTHYLNARRTLTRLLDWRVLPVINENDTTTTDELSFGDNDFLAAQVAVLVGADLLLLLTDTDGLHTADPRLDPQARLVHEVSDFAALEDLEIGHAASPLGSGGMRSKVVAAEMATAAGIDAVIANGLRAGTLAAAAAGEPTGTRFAPRAQRYSSFKLWLKYAKPTHGTVRIDAGAVRALREGGTSLLPVGVVDVDGDWDPGDAVAIVDPPGALIGKGICSYSASELREVKGMKSAQVRALLPRVSEEAVHRDYLVLD